MAEDKNGKDQVPLENVIVADTDSNETIEAEQSENLKNGKTESSAKLKSVEKKIYSKSVAEEEMNVTVPDIMMIPPDQEITTGSTDNNVKKTTDGTTTTSTTKDSSDSPDGFNDYRNKKTITQGMLDFALFTANVSQLKALTFSISNFFVIVLLCISLILQIAVGLLLMMSTRYNVNNQEDRKAAYKNGDYVLMGIFFTTIINLFISVYAPFTGTNNYSPSNISSSVQI